MSRAGTLRRGLIAIIILLVGAGFASAQVLPDGPVPVDPKGDGPAYDVTLIELGYVDELGTMPSVDELLETVVVLAEKDLSWVAPSDPWDGVEMRIADVAGSVRASGIREIARALVAELNRRGYIGVFVVVDSDDITKEGQDIRAEGDGALKLILKPARISATRTIGSGERELDGEKIDNPAHDRVYRYSPIRPEGEGADPNGTDLIRKDLLEEYLLLLNRHPGRRVEAAVSAGVEPGTATLDFLIREGRPWMVYGQMSNTGTEQTDEWRQRFGFTHNQLTGNDDILSVDFVTAGFDETNAFIASYEASILDPRWRYRVHALWSEFTASDVGFANEEFSGENSYFGAEIEWNFYQREDLFVDGFLGVILQDIEVENDLLNTSASDSLMRWQLGLRAERNNEWSNMDASLYIDMQSGADEDELQLMGRAPVDDSWNILNWNIGFGAYIEPLLNRAEWEDRSTAESSTLAHHVSARFRGQKTLGSDRVIPQMQQTIGGRYSVRGYEESAFSGDNSSVLNVEYALHIPRTLPLQPQPGEAFGRPFRWAPQVAYGQPDWDFILRGFYDLGHVSSNDKFVFEENETIAGAGVGVEVVILRNFSARIDWGRALDDVEDDVSEDQNQFHFVFTLMY